jgi:hypothetical protein
MDHETMATMHDGAEVVDDAMHTVAAAHAMFHGDSSAASGSSSRGGALYLPRLISTTGVSEPHGKGPASSKTADYR